MSFSEGFTSGFNMVDSAMQRRNANGLAAQKLEQDNAVNAENRALKLKELDDRSADRQDMNQYRQDSLQVQRDQNTANAKHQDGGLANQSKQIDNQAAYQEGSLKNQAANTAINQTQANTQGLQEVSAIAGHRADIATKKFALDKAKADFGKTQAQESIMQNVVTDADGTQSLRFKGQKDFDNWKTATGVDMVEMAGNYDNSKASIQTMRNATSNPSAFASNKTPVIDALNVLEKADINQGLGKQTDGTDVASKTIDDAFYHEPEKDFPEGYFTFSVSSFDKGGKKISSGAPLTEWRSSDPLDNKVRRITLEDLTKRTIGNEAAMQLMEANPELKSHAMEIYRASIGKKDDKKDNDKWLNLKSKTYGEYGVSGESESKVNPDTGETLSSDGNGNVKRGNVSQPDKKPAPNVEQRNRQAKMIMDDDNATDAQKKAASIWLDSQ